MKQTKRKQIPALLLALVMIFSIFPTGALAEELTDASEQTPAATEELVQTAETGAQPSEESGEEAAAEETPEDASEPDSFGSLWLTELFPNDYDANYTTSFGSKDDRFEFVELLNTSDQDISFNDCYQLLYGTTAEKATAISAKNLDGSTDVVVPAHGTLVLWNQRTNVTNPGTIDDFRSVFYIDDDVNVAIADYGKNWANAGYFALQVKSTETIFSDYTYVNGTISKTDGGDLADGLGVDLKIPDVGTTMSATTKKAFPSPGSVYAEQRGESTRPQNTSGIYVTEIYPNDGDRSAVYGTSDDYMEFVEITNTTDTDIHFNQSYQLLYLNKCKGTRQAICSYESAHKQANGEMTKDELYAEDVVIKANSSAVLWCYREVNLTPTTDFPDEAAFRAAYDIADDVDVYCMVGQNGMNNTDRGVAVTAADESGRQVMVSYYYYNGTTDTKDKKSVNLAPSAYGPRMDACALQQSPTPGSVSSAQFSFPEDDGSTVSLSLREGSTVPEYIMQGDELRVRFDYAATGNLPRTKITTYYRFDGTGTWSSSSETTRRVPGLYETNISANEIFNHSSLEFYVVAENVYHRTVTEVYTVEIRKLNDVDGIRTNISENEEVGGTVTVTANDGGDNANTTIVLDKGTDNEQTLTTTRMLEDGAYYTFQTSGRDSYFRNALVLADDNLTDDSRAVKIASLVKWQYYRLDGFAVHIDNRYFTYDAETDSYKITLRFWAGTNGATVYDYLEPTGNREDFTVSQLQLQLVNGKSYLPDEIGPSSYTYPDTGKTVNSAAKTNLSTELSASHSIGDSAGMCPYLDASFTIPAADATAVGATVDTTKLSEGKHTVTVSNGTATETVTFIVDNTAPEVELGVDADTVLSGDISITPKITEANTLAESIITLDGDRVNETVETNAVTLGAGEHTLAVYARDAAGNETEKSVTFKAGDDVIAVVDAATNDVGETGAALTVSVSGNTSGASATFYKLEQVDAGNIESNTTEGILPYITYTLTVGDTADTDTLILSWNGTASNADDTHASKLFVKNTATGEWDEVGSADETGSIDARFAAENHVADGVATVMVQCTADSALPAFDAATDGDTSAVSWDGYSVPSGYDFAFAWETDTQYYSEEFYQHYENMNNWIVNNADALKIRYVIHTGDIVDDFDMTYEWENANKAMKILDDAGMAYGVLGGNHDVASATFEYENYMTYFGEDRFTSQATYGGSYNNNLGHYDLLTENGQDFIVVYMSWDIYQNEIDWMNKVLAQYSDRKAILCFHTYTRVAYNADGTLTDYAGKLIQNEVVAKNPNVFAVLNGHYHGASYQTHVFDDDNDGVYDRTVYEICTDYQSGFEGGSGYVKMLYFDLDNDKIYINSYTPSYDDFNYYDNETVTELGAEAPSTYKAETIESDGGAAALCTGSALNTDLLTLNLSFDTDPQTILANYCTAYIDRGEVLGTAAVDAETNTATLALTGLNSKTSYAWYARIQNALGSEDMTAVQSFTTIDHAPQTVGAKDASCTGDGYTGDTVCSECGEVMSKGEVIPAPGHDYDENGVCTRCGAEKPHFDDVSKIDWYYEPVMWAAEKGITTGTGDNMFSPALGCTRGQIATFLWRAAGQPEPTSSENSFTDVSETAFYYEAVLWAVEKGITNGYGDGRFGPNDICTRGQIVTFLWRAANKPEATSSENSFTDISTSAFYYKAVLWAVENGITKGTTKTTFEPKTACTRAEAAAFLYRTLG